MAFTDNIAYQIAQILDAGGIGTFATDIFVSKEPDSPDNCVTVYNTGGLPDECIDQTSRDGELSTFQVRVRNNDYLTGHGVMEAIRTDIEKEQKTLGTEYFQIALVTLPNDLQRDTTNRSIITANFSCMRRTV